MPNYIANIETPDNVTRTIGGDNFDGLWKAKYLRIGSNVTLDSNGYVSYDLSSYLPDDDYDYEVIIEAFGKITSGVGNTRLKVALGTTSANASNEIYIDNVKTLVNFAPTISGTVIFVIPANNRNIVFSNSGSLGMTLSVNLNAFCRVGRNDPAQANQVGNINNIPIGGNSFNGQWVTKYAVLYNGTIAANSNNTIDLSSYLPAGNCQWEILFSLVNFGNDSGATNCYLKSTAGLDNTLCFNNVYGSYSFISNNNIRMPIAADRLLQIGTNEKYAATPHLYAMGYRRLGTNV